MQPRFSSTVSGEASHPDTKTMGTNSHGRHHTESRLIQMELPSAFHQEAPEVGHLTEESGILEASKPDEAVKTAQGSKTAKSMGSWFLWD